MMTNTNAGDSMRMDKWRKDSNRYPVRPKTEEQRLARLSQLWSILAHDALTPGERARAARHVEKANARYWDHQAILVNQARVACGLEPIVGEYKPCKECGFHGKCVHSCSRKVS